MFVFMLVFVFAPTVGRRASLALLGSLDTRFRRGVRICLRGCVYDSVRGGAPPLASLGASFHCGDHIAVSCLFPGQGGSQGALGGPGARGMPDSPKPLGNFFKSHPLRKVSLPILGSSTNEKLPSTCRYVCSYQRWGASRASLRSPGSAPAFIVEIIWHFLIRFCIKNLSRNNQSVQVLYRPGPGTPNKGKTSQNNLG